MAAILSQSQLTALFGQYRQRESVHYRQRLVWRLPKAGRSHVTFNGTGVSGINAGSGSGRERLTGALEEAANEFRRYSNALPPVHKKKRRLFSIFTRTSFGHPAASRIVCRG